MTDKPYLEFRVDKSVGTERGYDGDSVGITFAENGKAHSVVSHGVARALTTFCDHDVGVVTLGYYPGARWKQARQVVSGDGCSPTLTAEMGGHGNNFVHVFGEYGLSDAMQRYIVSQDDKYIGGKNVLNPNIAKAITTREGNTRADASTYLSPDCPDDCEIVAGDDGYPIPSEDIVIGTVSAPSFNEMTGRVHSTDGVSPAVRTFCGGGQETKIADPEVTLLGGVGEMKSNGGTQYYEQDRVYDSEAVATSIPAERSFHPNYKTRLRIRKLTEDECYRLMGFEESDSEACHDAGQSKSSIYHQAGDSIVSTVLVGIFGSLLGIDHRPVIREYAEKLHKEVLK